MVIITTFLFPSSDFVSAEASQLIVGITYQSTAEDWRSY